MEEKLGIIVVYHLRENPALLDLHLSMIEKNTSLPYTIYGSTNKLNPEFLDRISKHPGIKICSCPTTSLSGAEEHSYYLSRLVKMAVEDNATLICTLHVDSFPVAHGWDKTLVKLLTPSTAFVTLKKINTACMFFRSEFYQKYHPAFLPDQQVRNNNSFQEYLNKSGKTDHSGIGFGYIAEQNGLSPYFLKDSTNKNSGFAFGKIFGGLIYHFGGAIRVQNKIVKRLPAQKNIIPTAKVFMILKKILKLTPSLKTWLKTKKKINDKASVMKEFSQHISILEHIDRELKILAINPEEYIKKLMQ